jgi:hypothetical protein
MKGQLGIVGQTNEACPAGYDDGINETVHMIQAFQTPFVATVLNQLLMGQHAGLPSDEDAEKVRIDFTDGLHFGNHFFCQVTMMLQQLFKEAVPIPEVVVESRFVEPYDPRQPLNADSLETFPGKEFIACKNPGLDVGLLVFHSRQDIKISGRQRSKKTLDSSLFPVLFASEQSNHLTDQSRIF